ncbi:hypothetical protein quinque_005367 [Culex quinquefasciatus]
MYPKPRGLQCKMSQAVRLWVFLVAAVATLGLVAAKSVDQQQQHELLSCEHVSNFFSSINVTIKPTNKNQVSPWELYRAGECRLEVDVKLGNEIDTKGAMEKSAQRFRALTD